MIRARSIYTAPFGDLVISVTNIGVYSISFDKMSVEQADSTIGDNERMSIIENPEHPILVETHRLLSLYFDGFLRSFKELPLDLSGTEFQMGIWMDLLEIPYGRTVSYRELAIKAGDEKKSRAVGMACGRNPIMIAIPCHRVIGSSGEITGYAGGIGVKNWLLHHESSHLLGATQGSLF